MAGRVGFEPTTRWLTSALPIELPPIIKYCGRTFQIAATIVFSLH